MASEAYERNFQGLSNSLNHVHEEQMKLQKRMKDIENQLADIILRMQETEARMQTLLAKR